MISPSVFSEPLSWGSTLRFRVRLLPETTALPESRAPPLCYLRVAWRLLLAAWETLVNDKQSNALFT